MFSLSLSSLLFFFVSTLISLDLLTLFPFFLFPCSQKFMLFFLFFSSFNFSFITLMAFLHVPNLLCFIFGHQEHLWKRKHCTTVWFFASMYAFTFDYWGISCNIILHQSPWADLLRWYVNDGGYFPNMLKKRDTYKKRDKVTGNGSCIQK